MSQKIRVLIVQQYFRFYRVPLFQKLAMEPDIELTVLHGTNPPAKTDVAGLNMAEGPMPFEVIKGRIGCIQYKKQQVFWFGLALHTLKQREFDVVICDFFTRLLSIWPMLSLQHRRNKGFILWGMGVRLRPTLLTTMVRKAMVNKADAIIFYNEGERKQYVEMGVPPEKLFVAQNTVDLEEIDAGIAAATKEQQKECRRRAGALDGPLLLHVGRLAKFKRLDLLLRVLPVLKQEWPQIKLVLIGEGPEKKYLEKLVHDLSIIESVYFAGSITDAMELAPWFLTSDIVVAPAQIGLLAPESHAYGKALVTSDEPSISGPEAQVLVPGLTGSTYRLGDIDDLACC